MRSVQRIIPLSTALFDADDPLLREDLQMSRHPRRVDTAAIAETHRVLGHAAFTEPTDQGETVGLSQSLEHISEFFEF